MEEEKKADNSKEKVCFFIAPIGDEGSDDRRRTDGLIHEVLSPMLKEFGLKLECSHRMNSSGSITNKIIEYLLTSDLVIADLTGLNPNVMYELAIRHAKRKPVVCIAQKSTALPFDLGQERTEFYYNDIFGAFKLNEGLKNKIYAALNDEDIDNPIYRCINYNLIKENAQSISPDSTVLILKKLYDMEDNIAQIQHARSHNSKIAKDPRFQYQHPYFDESDMREPFWGKKIGMIVQHLVDHGHSDDEIRAFTNSIIHAPTGYLNKMIIECRERQNEQNTSN
ncbi:MAG: hypothetical protein LBT50_09785 [Prevotellaceae bacterium]|jgi:hypothetical protein|nr:hypothetical protein [Prevotellaceae bacterium]